jgi:hypothetical protein
MHISRAQAYPRLIADRTKRMARAGNCHRSVGTRNVSRLLAWLMDIPLDGTRVSRFAALAT